MAAEEDDSTGIGDQPTVLVGDGDEADDEGRDEGNMPPGGGGKQQQDNQYGKQKPCNQRIDELAMPNRRKLKALWNEHAYLLSDQKLDHLRALLEELYAMSHKEAIVYLEQLRRRHRDAELRRRTRQRLRRLLAQRRAARQRAKALRRFRKMLRALVAYACTHNQSILMASARLHNLSEAILEHVCHIMNIEVTSIEQRTDKFNTFLVNLADWAAMGAETIYFNAECAKRKAEQAQRLQEEREEEENKARLAVSSGGGDEKTM